MFEVEKKKNGAPKPRHKMLKNAIKRTVLCEKGRFEMPLGRMEGLSITTPTAGTLRRKASATARVDTPFVSVYGSTQKQHGHS